MSTDLSTARPDGRGHPVQDDGTAELGVPRSRIVIASLMGTSIEFYDFYILSLIHISEPTRRS